MKTSALITAAGLSSRMNDFKPLMKIDGISMIDRIINTFKDADIDDIIVVTGRDADILEASVNEPSVRFVRNERYASTQMLDSVKIGLRAASGCECILFTPVDVPLFTAETVKAVMETEGSIVIPTFEGKDGHPVKISSSLFPGIISYEGDCGLKGALNASCEPVIRVPVDDEAILFDADTPEEFKRLEELGTGGRF